MCSLFQARHRARKGHPGRRRLPPTSSPTRYCLGAGGPGGIRGAGAPTRAAGVRAVPPEDKAGAVEEAGGGRAATPGPGALGAPAGGPGHGRAAARLHLCTSPTEAPSRAGGKREVQKKRRIHEPNCGELELELEQGRGRGKEGRTELPGEAQGPRRRETEKGAEATGHAKDKKNKYVKIASNILGSSNEVLQPELPLGTRYFYS